MQHSEQSSHLQDGYDRSSRKIKKIQLEVYEDSEASFYLALASLKQSRKIDPNDVKSLLDSIYYPETWQTSHIPMLQNKLLSSWEYIYHARKYEVDYSRVSKESFSIFVHSDFGQALLNVFYHCNNLQILAHSQDDIKVKTDLSGFSLIIEALKNPALSTSKTQATEKIILHPEKVTSHSHAIERLPDGMFEFTDENLKTFELEFYVPQGDMLRKVLSFNDLQDISDHSVYYAHAPNGQFVIKFEKEGEDLCSHYLIGASIKNNVLDLTDLKQQFTRRQLIASLPLFDPEADAPYIKIEHKKSTEILINLGASAPIKINEELEGYYKLPLNAKSDSYVRYRIVDSIYAEVNKWFPDLSTHVKSTITGYLCIPFNLFDSEIEHENSPRTGSYHAYVGKTVRNILKSKP